MKKIDLLALVSEILDSDIVDDKKDRYVIERIYIPFSKEPLEYRYRQVKRNVEFKEDGMQGSDGYKDERNLMISVESVADDCESDKAVNRRNVTLREFLWNRLRLERIQDEYMKRYESWKEWNGGVDYVPVEVTCDGSSEVITRMSDSFFGEFCNQGEGGRKFRGLSLVMAEYGTGKTSFCMNLCRMSGAQNGWGEKNENSEGNSLKDAFIGGETAFPLIFDLNTFRDGDFDAFIVNKMNILYHIHLNFSVLAELCQIGIFSVVLDAWDQMRGTTYKTQLEQDLRLMRMLWGEEGRMLITCRRSFYQNQLRYKLVSRNGMAAKVMQKASLFTIGGFNVKSAFEYLTKLSNIYRGQLKKTVSFQWVENCWKLNESLMKTPINLRLLAAHFDTIMEKTQFLEKPIKTYDFLQAILERWEEENRSLNNLDIESDYLKTLVFMSLRSGLNRGISLEEYKEKLIDDSTADVILNRLRQFDFFNFKNSEYSRQPEIEFRLVVFQEFLWANYVLKELSVNKVPSKNSLICAYKLPLDVRAWITDELKGRKKDCLRIHLRGDGDKYLGLKYKDKTEIGYSASNVLTLFRDLRNESYYKDQLDSLMGDLRHFCFEEADLRGMDFSKASFDYSNLFRADLSYTVLSCASFRYTDLTEVIWEEFEGIGKCAFIEDLSLNSKERKKRLSIAAGTTSGSVLTYNLPTDSLRVVSLEDSTINAIAADAEGIYTAAQNGWVGYIEASSRELKNAYISANGLESIAAVGRQSQSVYVGAERNEIFRYNWRTGARVSIDFGCELDEIADVNYREIDGRSYIACILGKKRNILILLELDEEDNRASILARGELTKVLTGFYDICFAGDEIAYSIAGKGVYSISVKDMIDMGKTGILDDIDLCAIDRLRLKVDGLGSLTWAEEARMLFVKKEKDVKLDFLDCICWDEDYQSVVRDLEWYYDGQYYQHMTGKTNFCVSADGNYLAITGEKLAVFKWRDKDEYYELIRKPVDAVINVTDTDFEGSKGLGKKQLERFKERGAKFNKDVM